MKSADRLSKLRDLSEEELEDRRDELTEENFRLRFQWTMGQSEALKKMRENRRDRARVLTLLREQKVEQENAS